MILDRKMVEKDMNKKLVMKLLKMWIYGNKIEI